MRGRRGKGKTGEGSERNKREFSSAPRRTAFRPKEWALVRKLRTPRQVQGFLHKLPYNWDRPVTLRTFRGVVQHGKASCLEGALTAATILEQHGYPPLLLDLESQDDLDHVLFLFQRKGRARWRGHGTPACTGGGLSFAPYATW
jgi:hypothetical protein